MNLEKGKKSELKVRKSNILDTSDGASTRDSNKLQLDKSDDVKKKKHKKSSSNVDEFAFSSSIKQEDQYANFINNYDGKIFIFIRSN